MEKMLKESEEGLAKKRTEVEELEKEHQELRTRLAELQLKAEAKNSRDLKTALESIDDIRRDLTEIQHNNETTEEQILNISSKLENVEKAWEEMMKMHFDEKDTTAAKLEEIEEQAMVMSLEISESKKIQKTETEQKLKIMEKALEEQKEKLQKQQKSMEKALEDQRRNQEKLGESTKNLQKAQGNIAKLERTCGITNEQMQNMTAKMENLLNETVKWQRETSESRRMGKEKTEKFLEKQRKLNEKLNARMDWLEDKRTVEEYAVLFYERIQILMLRGGDTKDLLILDRDRLQWKTSPVELPEAGGSCGMICIEQEIYIFGGDLWDETFKLNKEMKWDRMADMNEGRYNISNSFLLFDGCIWLFGGLNQSEEDLNSVEKYIPSENKWIKMPSMKEKRKGAAAAVCGGKIYVCGGVIGTGGCFEALKSVECFDPKEEAWTKFVDLPNTAWGMGVISDGGCLIIYGGGNTKSRFKTAWKINPNDADPKWKELPSMKETRTFLTVQSIGKRIFAIGGDNKKNVEIFDGTSWESGPELPEICWAVPSVVVPHSLAVKLLPM